MASPMDIKAVRHSREDELLAKVSLSFSPWQNHGQSEKSNEEPKVRPQEEEATLAEIKSPCLLQPPSAEVQVLEAREFAPGTAAMRRKREEVLGRLALKGPFSASALLPLLRGDVVDSPLMLRLCGILRWGRNGEAYCYLVLLVAAALVAVFALQLYQEQLRGAGRAECPAGVCLHFGCLSDLVLAVGSLLGLVAMRRLTSLQLLGSSTAVLMRFAVQYHAVQKWSRSTSWHSLCLVVLWLGSVGFRSITLPTNPGWREAVQLCAFTLTSLIFMSLVFGVLHMCCCICVLIDNYALSVRADKDLVRGVEEWDKLAALLRRVSQGAEWGFSLVQTTAVIMLLCTITETMLQGRMPLGWFISNVLLAKGLVLLIFKASEVTEMCARMPSLINLMDFGEGNHFSVQKHYLVQHLAYSGAGFYVGEIRLTARMVLRITYVGLMASVGVLAKFATA